VSWVEEVEEKRKSGEKSRIAQMMKQFDAPEGTIHDPMASLRKDVSLDAEQARYAHLESFFKGLEELDDIRNNSNEFVVTSVVPKTSSHDKAKTPHFPATIHTTEPVELQDSDHSSYSAEIDQKETEPPPRIEPTEFRYSPVSTQSGRLPNAEDEVESAHWSDDGSEPAAKRQSSAKSTERGKSGKHRPKDEKKEPKGEKKPAPTGFRQRSLVSPFDVGDNTDSGDNFGGVV
jgi:hypothetical protein